MVAAAEQQHIEKIVLTVKVVEEGVAVECSEEVQEISERGVQEVEAEEEEEEEAKPY